MSRLPNRGETVAQQSLAQLAALPSALLDEPLEFIFADHFRQRSLCAVLRSVAHGRRVSRASAETVLAFLSHDLLLHHQDEDADLFPALRQRAEAEDELPPILDRLSEDHRQAAPLIDEIVAVLSAKPAPDPISIPAAAAETMFAYIVGEQRHLSIENGIVLVIARKRLKQADLATMSMAMKARRMRAC